jgi:hypothetical protein
VDAKTLGAIRPVAAAAGAALIASLFTPWAQQGGAGQSVWDLEAGVGVLVLLTGLVGIAAAATNGRIGVFRPDVSTGGAADLFGVVTAVVVGAFVAFGLPEGASAGIGAWVALAAAAAQAFACGDYRVLRGAPVFPRV